MIRRIVISNYALIRDLTLEPSPGFNIITGETGAGKSIILGALGLLLGKRADIKSVSNTNEKSSVEAEVILSDGVTHLLKREILPSGRSKAFIDGNQVNLNELTKIAAPILDIHSQHENLQLNEPLYQLDTIDKLAHNSELLEKYHSSYGEYKVALRQFADMRDEINRNRNDKDFIEFQLNEFHNLNLVAGEDDELEQTYNRLANNESIVRSLSHAANLLSWGNESTTKVMLELAVENIKSAVEISDEYTSYLERLEYIIDEIDSLADSIGEEVSKVSAEPVSIEELESQIRRINSLKEKHKVSSIEELIKIREDLSNRLEILTNSDSTLLELEQKARKLKKKTLEIANEISTRRKDVALRLEKELTERAKPLGMDNLVVKINVNTGKLNANGIDEVEFLFAFNKNQKPESTVNRASGGELSRLMLALKSIVVEHQFTPTIIFDEIDTGVSGDIANRMVHLMEIISKHIQVITITHLPQVAAKGDKHFKVYKSDDDVSTKTNVDVLSSNERRKELALMLSGNASDEAALAAADSLLKIK